jgi:hypothetical protein
VRGGSTPPTTHNTHNALARLTTPAEKFYIFYYVYAYIIIYTHFLSRLSICATLSVYCYYTVRKAKAQAQTQTRDGASSALQRSLTHRQNKKERESEKGFLLSQKARSVLGASPRHLLGRLLGLHFQGEYCRGSQATHC